MQPQFVRVGDQLINLSQVTHITQENYTQSGRTDVEISVHFAGDPSPMKFYGKKPEGKMILDWWEKQDELLPQDEVGGTWA
jgi:hypothetical protein